MINKEKTLIIIMKTPWFNEMEKREYNVCETYRKLPLILRIIRKYWIKYNLPFQEIWYGKWKKELHKYESIILFDSLITSKMVKYINSIFDKKLIVWYWNPVSTTLNPKLLKDDWCEKWSFDKEDSDKYNLKFNTTFYFKEFITKSEKIENDIFFIGKDKGRLNKILNLQAQFEKMNLNCNFNIVSDKKHEIIKKQIYKEPMSYDRVLMEVSKSKAILDIVQKNQSGSTLREMEALFLRKKLITNNKLIIKNDYYRKENIFILDVDNIENLYEFINTQYCDLDDEIIHRYDFDRWIKRILT